MIILQFFLLMAIFVLGWVAGVLITEEHKELDIRKKRKKPLTYPTYGDESPEEVFRMMEEAKKFKK